MILGTFLRAGRRAFAIRIDERPDGPWVVFFYFDGPDTLWRAPVEWVS